HIGRRRGRGKAYSDTTIEGMRRSWRYRLLPEFGPRIAEEITEIDWQRWIDELARSGLSRSTIAKHVSVASGIYASASAPSPRPPPPHSPPRPAAQRGEAAPARRAGARGGRLARRLGARGPPPLRDRLLRRPAALGDLPAGVGRRPRWGRDRDSVDRPPLQER